MKLKIPIEVDFDDMQSLLDDISHLQTYKLFEGSDELMVCLEDVADVLVKHIKAKEKRSDACENTCEIERKSNDMISRQQAIDATVKMFEAWYGGSVLRDREIRARFDALPSAQPEIIRCGECKYYTPVMAHCEIRGKGLYLIRGMEDFCSRAERREENE